MEIMTDLCRKHNFVIHVFLGKQGQRKKIQNITPKKPPTKNKSYYGRLENHVHQK